MVSVNLNEFLNNSKNMISIMYNKDFFQKIFGDQADFNPLKGKWLFIQYINGVGQFVHPSIFILNNEEFKIQNFYDSLEKAYHNWQILMPQVPFPDIQISSLEARSAFLSYDKKNTRHIIFLGIEDLSSLERFNFTIGHELGHLYFYFSGTKDLVNQKIKSQHFSKLVNWPMIFLGGLSCIFNGHLIYQNEKMLISIFAFIQILFWGTYILISLFDRTRLENYSMEFFSDYFSLWFMGKIPEQECGLSQGGWNGYTHPAGNWRLSIIKKTPLNNSLEVWENPVEKYSSKFSILSFYEMELAIWHFSKVTYNYLKHKLLTYREKRHIIK